MMLLLNNKTIMKKTAFFILIIFTSLACKKESPDGSGVPVPVPPASTFAKGADISWLTQMESAGVKFYNPTGAVQECMALMKSIGMNTIRLRVWVNPSEGWNNMADVVVKAIRAKNAGLRIMIDFHYSDTWADPGSQTTPAAWATQDLAALKISLATYTSTVLSELKQNNIVPEWVQVGNETNDGMLWPVGKASVNMNNFAQLITAGYDAVKSIFPAAKVIVHISNGYDNNLFRWVFDGLQLNGAKYDVIGMSLYPLVSGWATNDIQCLTNMNDMVKRYNKEVMMVEVGMNWADAAECNLFLTDIIAKTKLVTGGKGLGVLYWEPQAYNNWQGYALGAFDNTGKPTSALNAFR
jgi:arabinogalactan endo-1,4-beta-galactosidase